MPQSPFVARMGLRLLGRPSVDPRDVGARLDRALAQAARDADGHAPRRTSPVQVVGEAHFDAATYRLWRRIQLRRVGGGYVPELDDDKWALVLSAVRPSALVDFAKEGGTAELLGPPFVGRFGTSIPRDIALAATLAAWLDGQRAVVLAPPLLADVGQPYRLASLKRAWPLPVAELMHRNQLGASTCSEP